MIELQPWVLLCCYHNCFGVARHWPGLSSERCALRLAIRRKGGAGSDTYWELPFMRAVCSTANELAVMAYDTGLKSAPAYEALLSAWTRQLAAALPPPEAKGCEWLMGVPAYDDDKDYHRPDVETPGHSLRGILAGLRAAGTAPGFRGVAIHASFSADEGKWAEYGRLWRGTPAFASPAPDPRNTTE
jgi:hypothetical protein